MVTKFDNHVATFFCFEEVFWARITFSTIFCSSIKNARMILEGKKVDYISLEWELMLTDRRNVW